MQLDESLLIYLGFAQQKHIIFYKIELETLYLVRVELLYLYAHNNKWK